MSDDLPTALYRAITGGRTPRTEGGSVASMVDELQRAHGTHAPAGVSERTWRRLRADPVRSVANATRKALRGAQRRARLTAAREAKLRKPRPGIEIKADVLISNTPQKQRWLHVGKWPDPPPGYGAPITGMMNDVLDAWLGGDDAGAVRAFMTPISEQILGPGKTDVEISNITQMRLGRDSAG